MLKQIIARLQSREASLAVKRAMDVIGAAAGLLALSPVLAGTAAAILITQGRPILFRQKRPGQGGRIFEIYKFRTMRPPRPGEISYLADAERVTRLGRFLRRTSLDELPELWNLLRGDMSLVGPRPLLVEYLDKYTPEERRRHEVPAGLTGWAAVNGRHALQFKERLALDVWSSITGASGSTSRSSRGPCGRSCRARTWRRRRGSRSSGSRCPPGSRPIPQMV
jgi:lipopolysaccharide/colanic/teichoic acid biosynthesis glycosyltransferase